MYTSMFKIAHLVRCVFYHSKNNWREKSLKTELLWGKVNTFSFIRNCQTVFQGGRDISHPIRQWWRSPFASVSPVFAVVSVPDFGHFIQYTVVSHCHFNFYFSTDLWCGASFHLVICHLPTFFGHPLSHLFKYFLHFLTGLFVFLLLSFEGFVYSGNNPLSDMYLKRFFSQSKLVFLFSEQFS